jgi:hypothetical protein
MRWVRFAIASNCSVKSRRRFVVLPAEPGILVVLARGVAAAEGEDERT